MSKTPEKLFRIFVYGTLKRGQPNHFWLTRPENGFAKFLGTGTTVEKYPLVIGTRYHIPFLLDRAGIGHHVKGDLYEVDDCMLCNLDILEEHPEFYVRREENVQMNDQRTLSCWTYFLPKFPDKLLDKPYLISYENTTERPYVERSKRCVDIKPKCDLDF